MSNFINRITKYLHPEATQFYRKVDSAVQTLNSIQPQLDDTDMFYEGLGGNGYSVFAFQHNKDYDVWTKDTNKIYKHVSNYDDLLTTNLLFLKGEIPMTFYHMSPIYDINMKKLEAITKHFRYFTTEGQSSKCTSEEKQKNYLMGIIENDKLYDLVSRLEKQGEFYYGYYHISTDKVKPNLPFQTISIKEWRKLRPRDPDDDSEEDENQVKTFYNLTLSYNPKSKKIEIPFTIFGKIR